MVSCLMAKTEELSLKDVQDLHHKFGHASVKRLGELIKNANRLTENVQQYLNHVQEKCQSCMLNQNSKPRPAVSLPRATKFNEVVTVDLKYYKDGEFKFILYLVDWFSRLTVGELIPDKKPSTIGAVIMSKWVAVMGGRMQTLHSNRG